MTLLKVQRSETGGVRDLVPSGLKRGGILHIFGGAGPTRTNEPKSSCLHLLVVRVVSTSVAIQRRGETNEGGAKHLGQPTPGEGRPL